MEGEDDTNSRRSRRPRRDDDDRDWDDPRSRRQASQQTGVPPWVWIIIGAGGLLFLCCGGLIVSGFVDGFRQGWQQARREQEAKEREAAPLADPPPANGLMFQPPVGWRKSGKPSGVIFFDAPDLKPSQECRIAVSPPTKLGASFQAWFGLVQEPVDVIEESPVTSGTGRAGTQTLRVTKVIEKGAGRVRLHQVYHGIQDGDRYALLLFTARGEEVYREHLPTFDAMAASWDPRGRFPGIENADPGK